MEVFCNQPRVFTPVRMANVPTPKCKCTTATFYSVSISEPIPIRFGKKILKNSVKFSEPNWIRFGNKKQYLSPEKIPNRIQFGLEKNKQYSRRKNSEANTVWFKKNWSIYRKITHLLICPPVHLLIWSFQYWHEIAAIWWKQHESESENVKCIVFT